MTTLHLILLVGIMAIFTIWRIVVVERKVGQVHMIMNSRLDALIALAKSSSRAEGVLEGKAEKMAEQEKTKLSQ